MTDRGGIFAGDDPFVLAQSWMSEAAKTEPNDPNAIALSTVDAGGMPNVRMVLLKEIEPDAFVFYTNYESQKAMEIEAAGKAAFVLHWKSLARQIRVRGLVSREDGPKADTYYASPVAPEPFGRMGLGAIPAFGVSRVADGRGGPGHRRQGAEPGPPSTLGRIPDRPAGDRVLGGWCVSASRQVQMGARNAVLAMGCDPQKSLNFTLREMQGVAKPLFLCAMSRMPTESTAKFNAM